MMTVTQLSHELGITATGVHRKIKALGIRTRSRVVDDRRQATITKPDLLRLRGTYALLSHEAQDWPDSAAAARLLGYGTPGAFLKALRLGTITVKRCQVVTPGSGGRNLRYCPDDLRRLAAARPVRPPTRPRHTLSTPELQAATGASYATLVSWAGQGCPCRLLVNGNRYWRPAEVLTWLEGRPPSRPCHHAKRAAMLGRLRAHVQAAP